VFLLAPFGLAPLASVRRAPDGVLLQMAIRLGSSELDFVPVYRATKIDHVYAPSLLPVPHCFCTILSMVRWETLNFAAMAHASNPSPGGQDGLFRRWIQIGVTGSASDVTTLRCRSI
jgi:hypothetical protein